MSTTVTLPPQVQRRVQQIAEQQGRTVSEVVADLTVRALAQLPEGVGTVEQDPRTGFPLLRLGYPVTSDQVADLIDDEP